MMTPDEMLLLLDELITSHGPIGDEREVEAVILREFEATGMKTWQDGMSNIIAHVPGDGPRVLVAAHKDELGLIITHMAEDGTLRVLPLGGPHPWKYGEGPIDIIADDGSIVPSVLSFGSTHTRSGPPGEFRRGTRTPNWGDVTLFTGMPRNELLEHGVHTGSRAVVARSRKNLLRLAGNHIGGFAFDDRIGVLCVIDALRELAKDPPGADIYMAAPTAEETGYLGAIRVAQVLQPEIVIAVDTSPLTPDTPTEFDSRPVIWIGEPGNSKPDCETLLRLADELGFGAQAAVYPFAGSDAGGIQRIGLAARTMGFGPAYLNSHGYEITRVESLGNVTQLLLAFLRQL